MFIVCQNEKLNINMKNEIWTFIPTTKGFYQISNLGRVRKVIRTLKSYGIHIYSGPIYEIIEPKRIVRNYLNIVHQIPAVRITLHDMMFSKFPVSELMFLAFHGISNIQVNEIIHLDGNEENNALDNLILAKPIFKLQYLALNEISKFQTLEKSESQNQIAFAARVSKYSMNGELQKVFSNLLQVENADGILRRELLQSLTARRILPINDYFYKRGNGPQILGFSIIKEGAISPANFKGKRRFKFILQYSKLGKLVAIFPDIHEASKSTQCLKQHILKSIKTRQIVGHCLWVQLENQLNDYSQLGMSLAIGGE